MSEIVVTVKLPEGVDADGVEVTVDPMPAQTEESAVYPGSPIIRELQAIRIGMLDHYQAATILERLVGQARSLPIPAPAEARSVDPTAPTVLDVAWININVLGAPDTACRTPEDLAYCRGIGDALAEIEKLGGQPS